MKELLHLDRKTLEDRFLVDGDAGRAFEFFGDPALGGFGSGFVYTNLDAVSVGITLSLAHLSRLKIPPYELLDRYKSHPSIKPLIRQVGLIQQKQTWPLRCMFPTKVFSF